MMTRVSLLLFVVLMAAVSWASPCEDCQRVSLKPLDLSRTPTHRELIEAGQLGGNLSPTAPETRSPPADRKAFGEAMDAWNRHDYKKSLPLLKKHIRQFPDSPWKDEAELHLGCEARFNGRYAEAEGYFKAIIEENARAGRSLADHDKFSEVARKARLRLGMLEFLRGNFDESEATWLEIIETDPDRRRVDYARHWLKRTGLFRANAAETRRCGIESLSRLAQASGKPDVSSALHGVLANPVYGFRADELVALAAQEGLELRGVKAASVKAIPIPFIAHYRFGHFVTVTARDRKGNLTVFDPILNLETKMSEKDFSREWSGFALVQAGKLKERSFLSFLPFGKRYSAIDNANELRSFAGGCCGIENTNQDEGSPTVSVGGPCGESLGEGLCAWSFNPISMNIFVWDTPLWYQPAIGPAIAFSMSYNVIDADNNLPSFGPKWFFNYHSYAVETPATLSGSVTVFMPDGGNDVYSPIPGASNTFTPPARVFNKLARVTTNRYALEFPDGTTWHYEAPQGATNVQQALLSRIVDPHSNTVTLIYDGQPNPKLAFVVDALSYTSRVEYAGDRITSITDPFGRSMSVAYSNGYVNTVTDMGGVQSSYSFHESGPFRGWVKSVRTLDGEVTFAYTNNWKRETITATYEDGTTEKLYYNGGESWPYATEFTDRNGRNTKYALTVSRAFPFKGQVDYIQAPDGSQVTCQYNSSLQATNITDELGQSWSFDYNPQGRVTRLAHPNGYQAQFTYLANGFDLASVIEDGQEVLSLGYTAQRQVAAVTNALNQATRFYYDSFGRLTNTLDAVGLPTTFEYGAHHRLSRLNRAGIPLAEMSYDNKGRVTNAIGPDRIASAMEYDSLNRLTSLTLPDERPYRWFYATNSLNLEKTLDRTGRRTLFTYNDVNRLVKITAHDLSATRFEYTGAGQLKTLTDAEGQPTRWTHDARGRTTLKTYAEGDAAQAFYASNSLPQTFVSGRGYNSSFKYDPAGLLTNTSYSATNTSGVRCRYDTRNRLAWMADGWSTNTYSYDPASRLTNVLEVQGASTQQWTYAFDALDRLTGMVWQISGNTNKFTTLYQYDTLDRVTNITTDAGSFGYSYTNAGLQVSQLRYPNGETAVWRHDPLGRLTNHAYSTGGGWSYTYDSRDQVTGRTDPATNVYRYAYDDQGRLIEATGYKGTNKVSGYPSRWRFDRVGNVVERSATNAQRTFTYNANNQLLNAERPPAVRVRGYINEQAAVAVRSNTATNWLPVTTRFISATQIYYEAEVAITNWGTNNHVWIRATDTSGNVSTSRVRVTSYPSGPATRQTFLWDADGNYSGMVLGTNEYAQTWDAENRLLDYRHAWSNSWLVYSNKTWLTNIVTGTRVSRFRYDAWNRLREVCEIGTNGTVESISRYVWNGWTPVAELDASNKLIRTFTWGVDVSGTVGGAAGIGGLLAIRHGGTNYHCRTDGLGNVTEVRRTNGVIAGAYTYSPYGIMLSQSNAYNQPFRFSTRIYHARSGLYYLNYRWLDPNTGRFLSRDPIHEAGGLNLYAYVGGNPIGGHDPLGLKVRLNGKTLEQAQLLKALQSFVRGTLLNNGDGYISRIPCDQDEKYEALIDALITSDSTYSIAFGDASTYGGGSFSPEGFAEGGFITLSPDIGGSYMGWKGWSLVVDTRTTASVLAHELGHAITHVKKIRNANQKIRNGDPRKEKLENKAWKYSETPYERLNKAIPVK